MSDPAATTQAPASKPTPNPNANPLTDDAPAGGADRALTPHEFRRLRSVTLPVLKMEPRKAKYILILDAMHQGKSVDKDKGPATIVHALDMQTGEEGLFICPKVMQNELAEGYPQAAYVMRGFEVALTRVPDKRYNIVSLAEVSVPEHILKAGQAIAAAAVAAAKLKARDEDAAKAKAEKPNGKG